MHHVKHTNCYEIPWNNCDRFYVGQKGKKLEKRTKLHKYSVRTGQDRNLMPHFAMLGIKTM